jgi:hypothetical protein
VFPLDNSGFARLLQPKPGAGLTEFSYRGEITNINQDNSPPTIARSFTITADIEVPSSGVEGMIVTNGGHAGGYGLYVVKGKPVFTYNLLAVQLFRWESPQALTPGKHTIVFDFIYEGPGPAKGGTGVLKVDGVVVVDTKKIPKTVAFLYTDDETFDVGVDTRTGVNDADYHMPFRFTGKLNKVTIKPGSLQLLPEDQMKAIEGRSGAEN